MWFCANLLTYVILFMPLNNYEHCTMPILQMWNWGSVRFSKFAHVKHIATAGTGVCQIPKPVLFTTVICSFIRSPDKFLIFCQEYGCTKRTFSKFWKDYFWCVIMLRNIITTKPDLYCCLIWDQSWMGNWRVGCFIYMPHDINTRS